MNDWIPSLINQLTRLADRGETKHWGRPEGPFSSLRFSEHELNDLIATDRHVLEHYRFMKNGFPIEPKLMKLLDSDGCLVPARVDSLKRQGITIIASRLETKLSSIREFAREIQNAAGCYVRVVGIASYGSVPGMPRHFDHVDVFVVQTIGEKRWRFFGKVIKGAGVARRFEEEPSEETMTLSLVEGDQLFVPAGRFHQCDPAALSFHVAFNFKWPCALDLLRLGYEERMSYRTALLEPIRWFGQKDRLVEITTWLRPLLSEFSYSGDLESDLVNWPMRCETKFAVPDR